MTKNWPTKSPFLLLKLHGEAYNLAGQRILAASDLVDWVPHKTDLLRNSAKGIELITLEGERVTTISQARADQFTFSNDGQKLAYTQQDRNEQTQLKVFELELAFIFSNPASGLKNKSWVLMDLLSA